MVAHPVDFFRKVIAKGELSLRIIVSIMNANDIRPEILAFLMDELAYNYLARSKDTKKYASYDYPTFKFIIELILLGLTCAVDLIQRQCATFPDEMHAAAVESWHEGRAFNTFLHILTGADPDIFIIQRPEQAWFVSLPDETVKSGHRVLQVLKHFGDINENCQRLQSLFDTLVSPSN